MESPCAEFAEAAPRFGAHISCTSTGIDERVKNGLEELLVHSPSLGAPPNGPKWEFPKTSGTLYWDPYNKDPAIKGTILGSPIFGNP